MMNEVFEKYFLSLGLAAGVGLFRQPTEALEIIKKLRHTQKYFSQSNVDNIEIPAESLFVPSLQEQEGNVFQVI